MPPFAFVSTVKTFVSAGLGIERCSKNPVTFDSSYDHMAISKSPITKTKEVFSTPFSQKNPCRNWIKLPPKRGKPFSPTRCVNITTKSPRLHPRHPGLSTSSAASMAKRRSSGSEASEASCATSFATSGPSCRQGWMDRDEGHWLMGLSFENHVLFLKILKSFGWIYTRGPWCFDGF